MAALVGALSPALSAPTIDVATERLTKALRDAAVAGPRGGGLRGIAETEVLEAAERIVGEHGPSPFGLACWLDAVDYCRHEAWQDLDRVAASDPASAAKLALLFTPWEQRRCRAACAIIALFAPRTREVGAAAATAATAALVGAAAVPALPQSLLSLDMPRPVELRRVVLPPSTQRLLDSWGWVAPQQGVALQMLPGGLLVDPLLRVLGLRHEQQFRKPLLLPPRSSSGTNGDTRSSSALSVSIRDAAMCLFIAYPASRTRTRCAAPLDDTHRRTYPLDGESTAMHRVRSPLAHMLIAPLMRERPYIECLFFLIDGYLPDTERFGCHPETHLFVATVISYWLSQNPPFQVPLPGQSFATSGALPLSGAGAGGAQGWGGSNGVFRGPDSSAYGPMGFEAPTQPLVASFAPAPAAAAPTVAVATDAAPLPHVYIPVSLDVCESVSVLFTLLTCGMEFPDVIAGTHDPKTGGTPLWRLAERMVSTPEGQLHLLPHASEALRAKLRITRSTDRGRELLESRGGSARLFPGGTVVLPEVLQELHAPLFHFLRTHLEQAPLLPPEGTGGGLAPGGGLSAASTAAITFSSVVDVWLAVLAPWRSRGRWKGGLPNAQDMRSLRDFSLTEAANAELAVAAKAAGACSSRSAPPVAVNMTRRELARRVRSSPAYVAALAATRDYPESSAAGTAAGTGAAAAVPPAGEAVASAAPPPMLPAEHSAPWAKWGPSWVRLHLAFYTHLLAVFLRRLRRAGFAPGPGGGFKAVSSSGPPSVFAPEWGSAHILIAALERVLDVYEQPVVIEELRAAGADAGMLFSGVGGAGGSLDLSGSGAASHAPGVGAVSSASPSHARDGMLSLSALASSPAAGAAASSSPLTHTVHLLAHAALLKLPPDVSPGVLMPQLGSPALVAEVLEVVRALHAASDGLAPSMDCLRVPAGVHLRLEGDKGCEERVRLSPLRAHAAWLGECSAFLAFPLVLALLAIRIESFLVPMCVRLCYGSRALEAFVPWRALRACVWLFLLPVWYGAQPDRAPAFFEGLINAFFDRALKAMDALAPTVRRCWSEIEKLRVMLAQASAILMTWWLFVFPAPAKPAPVTVAPLSIRPRPHCSLQERLALAVDRVQLAWLVAPGSVAAAILPPPHHWRLEVDAPSFVSQLKGALARLRATLLNLPAPLSVAQQQQQDAAVAVAAARADALSGTLVVGLSASDLGSAAGGLRSRRPRAGSACRGGEEEDARRAAMLLGTARLGGSLAPSPDQVAPLRTWESGLLLHLTQLASFALLAAFARASSHDVAAHHRNPLRAFADVRIVFITALLCLAVWWCGVTAAAIGSVCAYAVLRLVLFLGW